MWFITNNHLMATFLVLNGNTTMNYKESPLPLFLEVNFFVTISPNLCTSNKEVLHNITD